MSVIKQIITSGGAGSDPNATVWAGAWVTATEYSVNQQVAAGGDLFLCISGHTSGATTEPGTGEDWTDVWVRQVDSVSSNQILALAGTSGTPGNDNKYVTDADTRMDDARTPTSHSHSESDISDLGSYSETGHTHSPSDVTNVTVTKTATGDLSAAEVAGTIISNYGQGAAMTLTLPVAAAGMNFTFVVSTTGNAVYLKANTNDKIYLNGISTDDNDKIGMAVPVLGNCITLFAFQTGASAYDWVATSIDGVWVDSGA